MEKRLIPKKTRIVKTRPLLLPHEPYAHPVIRLCDQDLDYPDGMSEDDKVNHRRAMGRLACVSLSSTATDEEINWVMLILLPGRSLGASP